MDWSQILEVLNGLAQPVLALFTLGLAVFTAFLWRNTKRYADATEGLARATHLSSESMKQMASSTDQHARITERLLHLEHLKFVERVWSYRYPSQESMKDMVDIGDESLTKIELEKAYSGLSRNLMDDIRYELEKVERTKSLSKGE